MNASQTPWSTGLTSIWVFAAGYFACYLPYSALTKSVSSGWIAGMDRPVSGFELLPVTTAASLLAMLVFLTSVGWWKFATQRTVFGLKLPSPTRWTFLSGICTATIIATTTLAYTFKGVSIVFMMLLMRGGVLVIAPIVDFISKRRVRWFSWLALALSLGALVSATFAKKSGANLTLVALVDVAAYLTGYFIRFRFMSRLAKSDDPAVTKKYFVEEQMVATPFVVITLVILALVGEGDQMEAVRRGFTSFFDSAVVPHAIAIGLLSQGTGVFGTLVFLDRRENSFSVPVNRASSILAGVGATYALHLFLDKRVPSAPELVGAGLVIGAILVLSLPSMFRGAGRAA